MAYNGRKTAFKEINMHWWYFAGGVVLIIGSIMYVSENTKGRTEHEVYVRGIASVGNAICGIGLVIAALVLYLMSKG